MTNSSDLSRAFVANTLDPASFTHRDHVRVAFELLQQMDFFDALSTYVKGLKALTAKAGVPQKFNATVTVMFLSLIAEKMSAAEGQDFEQLASSNPELFDKSLLQHWYSSERLSSPLARQIFLSPD